MFRLAVLIIGGSIVWPLVLGVAVAAEATGHAGGWTAVVYLAASRICHQLPARSFHTAGVQWPVCGRCAGLYLSAPFGALLGARAITWPVRASALRGWLIVASIPTLMTLALEWSGAAPVGNLARALSAVPLGAAIAFAIVRTVAERPRPIR